mmetsp:Transcript_15044/g.37466  ORF Transcript_15044/g.37466 Transcript_15044/m.37466 type:complete len:207 (-) Transcript_15044:989-1609(-)
MCGRWGPRSSPVSSPRLTTSPWLRATTIYLRSRFARTTPPISASLAQPLPRSRGGEGPEWEVRWGKRAVVVEAEPPAGRESRATRWCRTWFSGSGSRSWAALRSASVCCAATRSVGRGDVGQGTPWTRCSCLAGRSSTGRRSSGCRRWPSPTCGAWRAPFRRICRGKVVRTIGASRWTWTTQITTQLQEPPHSGTAEVAGIRRAGF